MAYNRNDRGSFGKRPARRKRKMTYFDFENGTIDYKDVAKLKKFVSERGKILPRRVTGACAKHQRAITLAVKRARHLALMPYTAE